MKNKLLTAILFNLFVGQYAYAAVIPQGDSITIGGRIFQLPNAALKVFTAFYTTTAVRSSFHVANNSGTAGYQVPGGKTLTLYAYSCTGTSASSDMAISYADNDVGYGGSNTAAVNQIIFGGVNGGGQNVGLVIPIYTNIPAVTRMNGDLGTGFAVPAGKYPLIEGDTAESVECLIYGTVQ